jgi:modification methylase
VDVVITSPPYNRSQRTPQRGKKFNLVGYGEFDDRLPQDVYEQKQIAVLNTCARVIKPTGSIFYVHQPRSFQGRLIHPLRWILRSDCDIYQEIIWNRRSTHKHEPSYLWPIHEYVFHLCRRDGKPRVSPDCAHLSTIWSVKWNESARNPHPAPFPEELVWRCLKLADPPTEGVVVDPYMGSGTTALVAAEAGLHFVGYEINPAYIRLAKMRLRRARLELYPGL